MTVYFSSLVQLMQTEISNIIIMYSNNIAQYYCNIYFEKRVHKRLNIM